MTEYGRMALKENIEGKGIEVSKKEMIMNKVRITAIRQTVYRGLRIVYVYDDGFHDDYIVNEELQIEYYE